MNGYGLHYRGRCPASASLRAIARSVAQVIPGALPHPGGSIRGPGGIARFPRKTAPENHAIRVMQCSSLGLPGPRKHPGEPTDWVPHLPNLGCTTREPTLPVPGSPAPFPPLGEGGWGSWGAGQDQDAPGYIRPHPLDPIRLSIAFQQWPGEYSIPDAPSPVTTHPRSPGSPAPSPSLGEGAGGVGDGLGSGSARITCGTSPPDPSGYPAHPNRDWAYLLRDAPCAASRLQCSGTSIASHRARGPHLPNPGCTLCCIHCSHEPTHPHAPAPCRKKAGELGAGDHCGNFMVSPTRTRRPAAIRLLIASRTYSALWLLP